jgi:hypothetical protein
VALVVEVVVASEVDEAVEDSAVAGDFVVAL